MRIDKKGVAIGMLVMIMITLVAFVLIAGTIMRFQSQAGDKETELICHNTLALRSKVSFEAGIFDASTPALCTTIEKKVSTRNKEDSMEFFSRAIDRCWWMFLDGKSSELFGSTGLLSSSADNKCFVCYNLIYEDGPTFSKEELEQNMAQVKSKNRVGRNVLSYVQENGYVLPLDEHYSVDNVYSVVFASNIEESFWAWGQIAGLYEPYNQNGVWVVNLNTLEKEQSCYTQTDAAGN